MSTLKEKAEQILQEKNEKIISENFSNNLTIFDVPGTLEEFAFVNADDLNGQITVNEGTSVDTEGHSYRSIQIMGRDIRNCDKYIVNENGGNDVAINMHSTSLAQSIGLTAEKIKKDETILGVTGTCEGKTIYDGYILMGTDKITSTNTDFNVSYINVRQVEYGPNLENTEVEYEFIICNLTDNNLRLSDYDFVVRFYDDNDNLIKSISLTSLYGMDGTGTMIYDHSNLHIHQHNQEFLTEYNWDSITKAQVDITPHSQV